MKRTFDRSPFKRIFGALWMSFLFLAGSACAEPVAPISKAELDASVLQILEDVASDWNSGNYDDLKHHWDLEDQHPIYVAEESIEIITNWDAVEAYWTASENWIEWIVVEYSNYSIKRVDDTNAMVSFDLRFDLKLKDRARPIGGDNRAVVSFRLIDGSWKIHSWIEAPLSAITYIRRLYEQNVRDDLPR